MHGEAAGFVGSVRRIVDLWRGTAPAPPSHRGMMESPNATERIATESAGIDLAGIEPLATEPVVAIEARALSRRYGRAWALAKVDLQVPAGKAVVVAGRNGSGKSTLLRLVAGTLRPDYGTVQVLGAEKRRGLSALVAHHSFTYDALSGLENLRIAARFLGKPTGRADLLARLDEVGLAARGDDPVHAYSAGMRKRLSLARALLQETQVLLLDEPYGQLDPPGFALMDHLIDRLRREGKTLLLASHQVDRTASICDLGLLLEGGRRVWFGPAAGLPDAFRELASPHAMGVAR